MVGTGGGLLSVRYHKMRGISWQAEDLLGSKEIFTMELVIYNLSEMNGQELRRVFHGIACIKL